MNLELLGGKWEIQENPGLETTDPRLDEISTLVQDAAFLEAARMAESILEESIYDVRILGFFLYGAFLEEGMVRLGPILQCLVGILEDNWDALGPAAKKEKHTQTNLRWLVNQLLKKVQYEEEKRSDLWTTWQRQVSSDEVGECIEAVESLRRQVSRVLEEAGAPVSDGLVKLSGWLGSFQQLVYREAEAEFEPEPPAEEEGASAAESLVPGEAVPRPIPGRSGPPSGSTEEVVYAEGSFHLRELMQKMDIFERLVLEGKYNRAALVADDVMEVIGQFDPKLYFPKLFARFFQLMAVHVEEISSYGVDRESIEWQVLRELYKVDREGFADL